MATRRNFLRHASALAVGGLVIPSIPSSNVFAIGRPGLSAADRVRIGAIGINGMGWSNLRAALKVPGVEVVSLCDVDQNVLNKRVEELKTLQPSVSRVEAVTDYRKMLENKDVDAVIIGTPDHWHCLQMVDAVNAGKDVYVEKPCGNSIEECNIMIRAQEKTGSVVQVGQWQRSQQHFQEAVDFVHSGQLGRIRTVKVWCYQGWMKPAEKVADSAVPNGVDYAKWLGPAATRPFNASRFHFTFRWFWDYAGGLMTDWGVHLLDYALLGMKAGDPLNVSALGGQFAYPDRAQETPDTLGALYQFKDFNLLWDHAMGIDNGYFNRDHGIAFIGDNGTLEMDRGGWEVLEERQSKNKVKVERRKPVDSGLDKHWVNFVDVVRSRNVKDLKCSIQEAARVARVAQLGNIAYRSGQKISWLASKNRLSDEALNRQYLAAKYHNGYKLPTI